MSLGNTYVNFRILAIIAVEKIEIYNAFSFSNSPVTPLESPLGGAVELEYNIPYLKG